MFGKKRVVALISEGLRNEQGRQYIASHRCMPPIMRLSGFTESATHAITLAHCSRANPQGWAGGARSFCVFVAYEIAKNAF